MIGREHIAKVLDELPGVRAGLTQPRTVTAGDIWPVWQSTTWLTGCATEITWYVLLALPAADLPSSIDAMDPRIDTVAEALRQLGYVRIAEPINLAVSDGASGVPCLRFTLVTP